MTPFRRLFLPGGRLLRAAPVLLGLVAGPALTATAAAAQAGPDPAGDAVAACAPLQAAERALGDAATMPDIDALYRARDAARDGGCRQIERAQVDRWLALGLMQKIAHEADSYAEAEPHLARALDIAGPWQLQALMGDALRARGDYDGAAAAYQLALQDAVMLADPASGFRDMPPPPAAGRRLRGKADEMRLAASSFVSLPGRPACRIETLGMWGGRVVSPIRFVTDETTFTEAGAEAARELLGCLKSLDPDRVATITIIGHTDERGPEAYNRALSERRAERVRTYLAENGFTLPMQVEGRGESELFRPDDPDAYPQEVRWQMSRRVEVDIVQDGDRP